MCKPCDPQLRCSSAEQTEKALSSASTGHHTGEDALSESLGHIEPGHQEFRSTLAEDTLVST